LGCGIGAGIERLRARCGGGVCCGRGGTCIYAMGIDWTARDYVRGIKV
jgi:hypothetical protein